METKQLEGRCLCGAVTVRGTPTRLNVEACHCTMCRRWNGLSFLGTQFGTAFELGGEEHVVRYRSSEWAERGFCGRCGTSLFYHYLPNGNHAFTAGLFPDDAFLPLNEEIFIDEKPAYYAFDAESEKLTGPEVMAKFGVGQEGND